MEKIVSSEDKILASDVFPPEAFGSASLKAVGLLEIRNNYNDLGETIHRAKDIEDGSVPAIWDVFDVGTSRFFDVRWGRCA